MITYTKNEIISSTSIARNFGLVLNKLRTNKLEKVAVLRNNRMEAIIIPVDEYEKLKELAELAEHAEIYNIFKQREKDPLNESIPFEDVLKEYGIDKDEL